MSTVVTTWFAKPGKMLEQSARKLISPVKGEDIFDTLRTYVAMQKFDHAVNAVEVVDTEVIGVNQVVHREIHIRKEFRGQEYWNVSVDPVVVSQANVMWVAPIYPWLAAWQAQMETGRIPANLGWLAL
jgi:hypothetical protein